MAMCSRCLRILAVFAALFSAVALRADGGRFDLTGPKIEVRVARAGKMLPIAAVPNLQPGDQIWLHADLPPSQAVHYLLVAVFLRGNTNPPPDSWFTRIETWDKHVRQEGATITVPEEAQQALLFLAPETGGDFSTLRSAVRGRPGIFVRASQDLTEAGFEQARIEKYLASMRQVPPSDPKGLQEHSALLARTLNLKPNDDCFKRPIDQQFTCLTQTGSQSLLDDGHGATIVSNLVSGAGSDFITAASTTSLAGGGNYSAYVGAVVDLVRLTSGLHTAHYQYIPAIAFPQEQALNLRLNTPPSFNNPKSVIVIGLPSVQPAVKPPLRPADPKHVSCLLQPGVVLPVEGAPLVFSTAFAHDLTLHVDGTSSSLDIPVTPDPFLGGLVLAPAETRRNLSASSNSAPTDGSVAAAPPRTGKTTVDPAPPSSSGKTLTGTIKGFWGFDEFTGPSLKLQNTPGIGWTFLGKDPQIIAGQENHLTISGAGTACIQSVMMDGAETQRNQVVWKAGPRPDLVDVTLTPPSSDPGKLQLSIQQFGASAPAILSAQSFSEPAQIATISLHARDTRLTLTGSNLSEVHRVRLGDLTFEPPSDILPSVDAAKNQVLSLDLVPGGTTEQLKPGSRLDAQITLQDGRMLSKFLDVAPPRPSLTLLSIGAETETASVISLSSPKDLALNSHLTVSLRLPTDFPRNSQLEVATLDGSLQTRLSLADGSLVLQDSHTILARLDPSKVFGQSAFGDLHLRQVDASGSTSDWLPLGTLVRLPKLKELHCPADASAPCTLTGSDLYLVSSFATDAGFTGSTPVPQGFVQGSIAIPHPNGPSFFLKLRDDPSTVDAVTMPILPL